MLLTGTTGLAGKAYGVPSRQFWESVTQERPYVVIVLLLLVGVFGALTPVEALTARARAEHNRTVRHHILSGFGQIVDIARLINPPLDISDLALHVWRIRRTWRHPLRGVLTRTATYRLGMSPMTREFSPPQGKGVVGLCWERNYEVEMDVEALTKQLGTEQEYSAHKGQHGGAAVMNLTWDEFTRFSHRGAVFANPIRNGRNRFAGCLSVDASHGYAALAGSRLQQEMSSLCLVIGQAGLESC